MGLHHRPLHFADQLDGATGNAVSEIPIEVVDRHGLLKDNVVCSARIYRRDVRVAVDHVVATHQPRGIPQPGGVMIVRGRQ